MGGGATDAVESSEDAKFCPSTNTVDTQKTLAAALLGIEQTEAPLTIDSTGMKEAASAMNITPGHLLAYLKTDTNDQQNADSTIIRDKIIENLVGDSKSREYVMSRLSHQKVG